MRWNLKIFNLLLFFAVIFSFAGERQSKLKIGLNLGGTMPFPMPNNINKVENYSPNLMPTLEAETLKWVNKSVGVSAGIRFDNKGMKSTATVKEYEMNFENLKGRFRGIVDTEMNFNYLGLPILAHYIFTENVSFYAGAYYAYMLNGEFKGTTSDGFLNSGSGPVEVVGTDYDFSKDLRNHDVGLSIGMNFLPYNEHILFSFDFNYGLVSIFPGSFNGISDEMQNIYGKLSVGYVF
jgi:hypothetical protein